MKSGRITEWGSVMGVTAMLAACSSSPSGSDTTGTAGNPNNIGTGGAIASGGNATGGTVSGGGKSVGGTSSSTGGSSVVGGSATTGGSPAAGGSLPTGGRLGAGGVPTTGGTAPNGGTSASGGAIGVGGTQSSGGGQASGGAATGGRMGTGGSQPAGGGSSGSPAGGSASGGTRTGGTNSGGAAGFEPCPASGACKIMPLGDSITDGTGFSGGYRVELFAKTITDKKSITFVGSLSNGPNTVSGVTFPKSHEGHFGWRIDQVDALIPDPALAPAPHIVLLHLGTNDINQSQTTGAPDRLGLLIDQVVTKLPSALVVVAQIIPEPSKSSAISTYNAAIPGIVRSRADAGKHVILVDQFTGFPSSELGDGVHPNQAGYARMAGVWYEAIKSHLH
jgi:lysophospholipase L1-like esterase